MNSHRFLRRPLVGSHRRRFPPHSSTRSRLHELNIIHRPRVRREYGALEFYPEVNVCFAFSRNDALAGYRTEARVSRELE